MEKIYYETYTKEDRDALDLASLEALDNRSMNLGVLYCYLLEGKHAFYKFTENRYLGGELSEMIRSRSEKRILGRALQRLRKQGLIEMTLDSRWRITFDGIDKLAGVHDAS